MKFICFFSIFLSAITTFSQGLIVNTSTYGSIPKKINPDSLTLSKLPKKVDLSKYVPSVIDQEEYDICVPVSTTYYLRTMLEAIKRKVTNKNEIDALSYSPSYIYNLIKPDALKKNCKGDTYFEHALEMLKTQGTLKFSEQSFIDCRPNSKKSVDPKSRILDYTRLFDLIDDNSSKVNSTKKVLSENSPLVVGLQISVNLKKLGRLGWLWHKIKEFFGFEDKEFALWKPNNSDVIEGHAVCVVGYDDKKFVQNGILKGAFKAVNSRGKRWGDDGFFWILYDDYERLAKQAYQAYLPEVEDLNVSYSGEIAYLTDMYGTVEEVSNLRNAFSSPVFNLNARNEAEVEINLSRGKQDTLTAFKLKESVVSNTSVRYAVKTINQFYLYVLNENAEGNSNVVFPLEYDGISEFVSKNSNFILPIDSSSNNKWKISGTKGLEKVAFLFSKEKIDIYSIEKQLNNWKGSSLDQKLIKVFKEKMIPLENIKLDKKNKKKMKFSVSGKHSSSGTIIPIVFSYEHV